MKIIVVGSGPSGVHFALTVLRKNHQVVMIDVGRAKSPPVLPTENFVGLKSRLEDPVDYFLGSRFGAINLPALRPGSDREYYGLPPSKDYVFEKPKPFAFVQEGLSPLLSFAAGGLAESWTGGCYPLNEQELSAFPFSYDDIAPHYAEVARRIGVAGEADDLSEFFPHHDNLLPMLELDESSKRLLSGYERRREKLKAKYKARLGRSRQAVLSRSLGGRNACMYCGRCLWGCPNGAFYTPSLTLEVCLTFPNFTYVPGAFASHFRLTRAAEIESLVTLRLDGATTDLHSADAYVLACGALSTSNVVLRTFYKERNEIVRLTGLMDNRQILAPFLNISMLGRDCNLSSYQYHQLAFGIEASSPDQYVHGQVTTLKTATAHAIFRNLPLDLNASIQVFRNLRSCLGVLNLNYSDWRRDDNYLTLASDKIDEGGWPALSIHYRPASGEAATIERTCSIARRFFTALGAPFVPGMMHIRPMGSSVHYSGTLPMSMERKAWTVSPSCQSYDIDNLYIVDGAVMPFLPAKNLTFTLMANAVRVGEIAF